MLESQKTSAYHCFRISYSIHKGLGFAQGILTFIHQ